MDFMIIIDYVIKISLKFMTQENKSPSAPRSISQKTCAVREFFTAMLATVALSAVGFGIAGKFTATTEGGTFSMKEGSKEVSKVESTSREFAQQVVEPAEPQSAYDQFLAELIAGTTPSPELYVEAAKELLSRGAGDDAKAIIQSALIAHPYDETVAMGSFDVRAATGDAAAAWQDLAQTGDTSNPEVMSRLIKFATTADKVAETTIILGDLELLPWTPTAEDWSNMVSMFTNAGDFEQAKKAVDLSPERELLKRKLEAADELEKGNYDRALEKMDEYTTSTTELTTDDWALLAQIYTGQGDTVNADAAYRKAEGLAQL